MPRRSAHALIGQAATGLFLVTLLYLLARPGSHSVDFVRAFSEGAVALTSAAADFA